MRKISFLTNLSGLIPLSFLLALLFVSCASGGAIKAEEYFSIGMAYYDMGKYAEAEQWLNRARAADRTMTASEYNLGRIAFETGRYEEAARHFENILGRDPDNVMALKAAAFSRIKNGDLEKAEALYDRVLVLVPESVDDGYNYALVLYGLKKFDKCEETLNRYPNTLEENSASLLLLARAQKAQNKVEAIDSYDKWLLLNTASNPQALYEYAQVLENAGLYARAIEQYSSIIGSLGKDTDSLKKADVRFEKARLLLTADPENPEGIEELKTSVNEGFSDTNAIETLLLDQRITRENKEEINKILAAPIETEEINHEEENSDDELI